MPELVTIPISFFEASFNFREHNPLLWLDRAKVVQALFTALKPWKVDIDNVEIINTGKTSEQGLKFKLPEKRITFFFGATLCKFSKDNADWATAEETIEVMNVAVSTLVESGKVEIATIETAVSLHLQMKAATPFIKILSPFIPPKLASLEDGDVRAMACILKWEKRRVYIDGSAQVANAIYLRFEREFEGQSNYAEIAKQILADEQAIFTVLDVAEDNQ
jgi:hypothetical protein